MKCNTKLFFGLLLNYIFFFQTTIAYEEGFKDYLLAYGLLMGTAVVHEAGHAIALKALYDESCDINIGAFSPESSTAITIGKIHFKYPLMPYGYVQHKNYGKNHLKDIAVSISGPILGSFASFASLKLLENRYPSNYDYRWAKAFMRGGVLAQLLNLIPHPGFDGHHIYESLKKLIANMKPAK